LLRCIWTFLSNPTNQATLAWIFGGLVAAIGGIWAALWRVFPIWVKYRNRASPQPGSKGVETAAKLAVRLSLVATLSAAGWTVYWIWSELESYCPDCNRFSTVTIKAPKDGDWVSQSINAVPIINGVSKPSQICRYLYVFAQNIKSGDLMASDLTQTTSSGVWSGRLDLDRVGVWDEDQVKVLVILIDEPKYPVGVRLLVPPVEGRISDPIWLRRQ
jgi:hypothetical protein